MIFGGSLDHVLNFLSVALMFEEPEKVSEDEDQYVEEILQNLIDSIERLSDIRIDCYILEELSYDHDGNVFAQLLINDMRLYKILTLNGVAESYSYR